MELANHVIKTITKGLEDLCWKECVWLPKCFSLNVRMLYGMLYECDLNNSTKRAAGGLVNRAGSDYHEMAEVGQENCRAYECRYKQVLQDGWFRLDSSSLKFFKENKNWTEAVDHCKSIGGNLVSITSVYKDGFVYEVVAKELQDTENRANMKIRHRNPSQHRKPKISVAASRITSLDAGKEHQVCWAYNEGRLVNISCFQRAPCRSVTQLKVKCLNISTDPRFVRSNQMLDVHIKRLKRSGKDNIIDKPYIEDKDLQKLKSSTAFSLSSSLSLLQNVFYIILHFCKGGRED
ncbi:hypothetical protein QZH41_020592 [Actinostola sp. cb2023]|nr:hypothetical protein QZH41_020592 [Actinostola sp. cb2023]